MFFFLKPPIQQAIESKLLLDQSIPLNPIGKKKKIRITLAEYFFIGFGSYFHRLIKRQISTVISAFYHFNFFTLQLNRVKRATSIRT